MDMVLMARSTAAKLDPAPMFVALMKKGFLESDGPLRLLSPQSRPIWSSNPILLKIGNMVFSDHLIRETI
ncbi:MAG: hypothetical protein ABFD92_08020 [Planctomycetaceae bacterium]|nr:hypothetical protein [Planctomycetaceae bacterium]